MKQTTNGSKAAEQSTKVITGKVRFSYAHVFEPSAIDDKQEKKYSVSIIIPKKAKQEIAKIQKAIDTAISLGKTSKFGNKTANLKLPLRDGDVDRPEDEAYQNSFFISASSKARPGVVDADLNPIMSQEDFYSGCYGRASINFYPFNQNGNKGIACGLNNIQKLEDGEALSGRPTAEEDFGDGKEDDSEDDDLS